MESRYMRMLELAEERKGRGMASRLKGREQRVNASGWK